MKKNSFILSILALVAAAQLHAETKTFKFWNKSDRNLWFTFGKDTSEIDKRPFKTFHFLKPNDSFEDKIVDADNYETQLYFTMQSDPTTSKFPLLFRGFQFPKDKNIFVEFRKKGDKYEFGPASLLTLKTKALTVKDLVKTKEITFFKEPREYINLNVVEKLMMGNPYFKIPVFENKIKADRIKGGNLGYYLTMLYEKNPQLIQITLEATPGNPIITQQEIKISPYDLLGIAPKKIEKLTIEELNEIVAKQSGWDKTADQLIQKAQKLIMQSRFPPLEMQANFFANPANNPVIQLALLGLASQALPRPAGAMQGTGPIRKIFFAEQEMQKFCQEFKPIYLQHKGVLNKIIAFDSKQERGKFTVTNDGPDKKIIMNPLDLLGAFQKPDSQELGKIPALFNEKLNNSSLPTDTKETMRQLFDMANRAAFFAEAPK